MPSINIYFKIKLPKDRKTYEKLQELATKLKTTEPLAARQVIENHIDEELKNVKKGKA